MKHRPTGVVLDSYPPFYYCTCGKAYELFELAIHLFTQSLAEVYN